MRQFISTSFSLKNGIYLLLLLPFFLKAQNGDSSGPTSENSITIYSKILNENRKIFIRHPEGNSVRSNEAYPVLYALDAENHFDILSSYCKYFARLDINATPEMIVVSIENTNRNRDLTPTHSLVDCFGVTDTTSNSWLKESGGNDKFLQFIREELIPYIDSHYKLKPFKIFAGHSFGGMTTINCLLRYPDMFNAYISISPTFYWDGQYILKLAEKKLKMGSALNKILFISDGNEGINGIPTYHTDLLKFDSLLTKRGLLGLDHKYVYYPDETHMTEPVKAYSDALRFIFKGWDLNTKVEEIRLLNASVYMNHSKKLSLKYGYTILPNEMIADYWANYIMTYTEKLENAISIFEMNTQNYPGSSQAFAHLAEAYVKKGDIKKGIGYYKKAISLNLKDEEIKARLKVLQNLND